jgi:hypothetical protein
MAIEVETPETVTAVLTWPGGETTEVVFTRAEYATIEAAAAHEDIEPNEWIMRTAIAALNDPDKSPAAFRRRGLLGSA